MSIEYYNQNADEFFENTVNVDMSQLYERFTKFLNPGAKILDAGCGSGRDTKAFLEMGYSVDAFDASEEMVKRATEYTGINVKQMTFDEVLKISCYDGIWCCASMLHVPRHSLQKTLNNLNEGLKPNGVIYVSFKLGNGERIINGRQFTDLNESSLIELIQSHKNLFIEDLWITKDKRPDKNEHWINAILSQTS